MFGQENAWAMLHVVIFAEWGKKEMEMTQWGKCFAIKQVNGAEWKILRKGKGDGGTWDDSLNLNIKQVILKWRGRLGGKGKREENLSRADIKYCSLIGYRYLWIWKSLYRELGVKGGGGNHTKGNNVSIEHNVCGSGGEKRCLGDRLWKEN